MSTYCEFGCACRLAGQLRFDKVCVVEVEEIVQPGELDADAIHLPGVYVQRLIVGAPYDKKIEFRTTRTTDMG